MLAPTRELTAQIKAEAVKLLTPHGNTLGVQARAHVGTTAMGVSLIVPAVASQITVQLSASGVCKHQQHIETAYMVSADWSLGLLVMYVCLED